MTAEKLFEEQTPQPKVNFKDTPFAKALPITIGLALGMGFGPGLYKAIGETTGWGTYSIGTFCVGTLILCVGGGFIGYVSQLVIDSYGKATKA